jgi:hypothetical protein
MSSEEIVVSGRRAADAAKLDRMMRDNTFVGGGDDFGRGSFGVRFVDGDSGGGGSIVPNPVRAPARSTGPQITPAVISQPRSTLGTLTGTTAPKGYGLKVTRKFKKGGFAVKPVWDKKRPDDLGKPKDLSVKKKKAAKARAKAAGRPYPNLVDNMAAARKKGK